MHLEIVDVSLQSSVRSFAQRFDRQFICVTVEGLSVLLAIRFEESGERCDVLVNNAGVMMNERTETSEGIETTFATNTLGACSNCTQ